MRAKLLLLALTAALAASTAFAAGPLILQGPNNPYEWGGGVQNVYTDLGACGPTLTNAEADAITAASFGQWSGVASSYFNAAVAGDFAAVGLPDITGANAGLVVGNFNGGGFHVMYDNDGTIITNFFGAPPGVLGIASPDFVGGGGNITESWAVMNGTAVDPADVVGNYFAGVFTHEFGHAINLAHSQVNGARIYFGDDLGPNSCALPYGGAPGFADIETMYPFIDPSFGSIGIDVSTIDHTDDETSISDLHPTGGYPGNALQVSGTIFHSDGTSEIGGVNVIVRNLADPFGDAVGMVSGAFTQTPTDGDYFARGLTPGANYVAYIDGIVAGGFSQTPVLVPAFAEEFHDAAESNSDNRCNSETLTGGLGANVDADVIINEPFVILGDDSSLEVSLPFSFPFCGVAYNSVFVNANGNLTFGSGDGDFSPTVSEFLNGAPRIAALWADLSPQANGQITAQPVGPNYEVRFQNIYEFNTTNENTFTFILRPDGTHDVVYGTMQTTAGLAGRTEGGGAPNPGGSDLSALAQPIVPDNVYQNFGAGFDLGNSTLEYGPCGDPCIVNAPPNAICQNVNVAGGSPGCSVAVTPAQVDGGSNDPDGTIVNMVLDPAGPYPEGVNLVELIVIDDCGAADTCSATITVTCPVGPIKDVSPLDFTFAPTGLGDTTCVTIKICNTGDQNLDVNSVVGCGGDFYVDQSGLVSPVAPGDSTFFDICFAPTGPGPDSCLVTVNTNDGSCDVVARVGSITSVPGDGISAGLSLSPVFPNPFRASAEIRFSLVAGAPVRMDVFDLRGRKVRTLIEDTYSGGTHAVQWDGLDDRGAPTAAGVYMIRIAAGDESQVVRAVRMR